MEVAMVGREGVVGSPEVIHALRAIGSRVVQLPGRAVQLDADAFQEALVSRPRVLAWCISICSRNSSKHFM
jgi:hypothetical protein